MLAEAARRFIEAIATIVQEHLKSKKVETNGGKPTVNTVQGGVQARVLQGAKHPPADASTQQCATQRTWGCHRTSELLRPTNRLQADGRRIVLN